MDGRSGAAAVVLAAGQGTRMGADGNKAYLPLAGRRMVSWSLEALGKVPEVVRTILMIRPDDRALAERTVEREVPEFDVEIVDGGTSRHQSEYQALQYLAPDIESGHIDIVLVHDAARPLAGPGMMRAAVSVAREFGGAVPGLDVDDLVEIDDSGGIRPVAQSRCIRVQTPQAFRAKPLLRAYRDASNDQFEGTDTSSSVERYSDLEVRAFQGDERNLKVTYARDLILAEHLITANHFRLT